jgi:hypothetical protein
MTKNWLAAQKHSSNLKQAHEMLSKIIKYVEVQNYSDNILNGTCTWINVAESARIVIELKDLHDRITGSGEYSTETALPAIMTSPIINK